MRVGTMHGYSFSDAFESATVPDFLLLGLGYALIFAYGVVSSGLQGFLGVFVVMLALVGSLGFSSLLGVSFNMATVQVIPFLLLGLGVNDMFILAHS